MVATTKSTILSHRCPKTTIISLKRSIYFQRGRKLIWPSIIFDIMWDSGICGKSCQVSFEFFFSYLNCILTRSDYNIRISGRLDYGYGIPEQWSIAQLDNLMFFHILPFFGLMLYHNILFFAMFFGLPIGWSGYHAIHSRVVLIYRVIFFFYNSFAPTGGIRSSAPKKEDRQILAKSVNMYPTHMGLGVSQP